MVDLIGNLVFLGGQALILLILIYIWWSLLMVERDYITFALLTIFMIAGAYVGYRQAIKEG